LKPPLKQSCSCLVAKRALQRAAARAPVLAWSLSEAWRELARSSLTVASARQEEFSCCRLSLFLASRRSARELFFKILL
ncbi:hypothetical protein A2U01_0089160, partial [Trifolium medium]|nr:hypothetical protein [Trifolium medium]